MIGRLDRLIDRWDAWKITDLGLGLRFGVACVAQVACIGLFFYYAFTGSMVGVMCFGAWSFSLGWRLDSLGRALQRVERPIQGDTARADLEAVNRRNAAQLEITRREAEPERGRNDVAHVECYYEGGHEYAAARIGFDRCRWCGTKRPAVAQYIRAGVITGEKIRTGSIKGDKIHLGSTSSLPQRSGPDEAPAVAGTDTLEDIVSFHGGPRDGLKMHIPGAANRKTVQIENGDLYEHITDPDTGEFLGGYVHVPMTPAKRCEMTGHLRAWGHPECMRCGEGS